MVNIKLADVPIQLNNSYPDLEYLCRGYETDEKPQFSISVTKNDIEFERSMQTEEFTDGYLETVCMYRKIALEMLNHNVFIMHASIIAVDGKGYAFLAPSGTGKTTQTRLWLQHFGERAHVVNGDKPLIKVVENESGYKFIAYGTPWCGKENMGCNSSVFLKGLFLLERAENPSCELASQEYSIDKIFRQMLMPEQAEQMNSLLTMIDQLIETVPAYILRCNMKDESVVTAFEAVQ